MSRKNHRISFRLIALFLLFSLTLSLLSSCKSDGGDKETLRTVEVTNQYRVVLFEAPEGYAADRPYAIGGKIYIRYYDGDDTDEAQKNLLYVYDQTGAALKKNELTAMNPDRQPCFLIPSGDGAVFTVENGKIRKTAYDGAPIFEIDVQRDFGIADVVDTNNCQLLHCGGFYFFMLTCSDRSSKSRTISYAALLALTESGEPVNKIVYDESSYAKLFQSPAGDVMFYSTNVLNPLEPRKYYTVDTDAWKAEKAETPALPEEANLSRDAFVQVNSDSYYDAGFSDAYTGYYKDTVGLYGYNPDAAPELLVNWTNSGLTAQDCEVISVLSPDAVLCVIEEVSMLGGRRTGTQKIPALLIKVPDEEEQGKTVLTLAITAVNTDLYRLIVNFNRSSEKYRVVVDDYTVYNSSGNTGLAEQRFDLDLASGVVHDIVFLYHNKRSKYIEKEIFADLYEFFDADETFSRESLLGCIRQNCETDGKLFAVPRGFYISTLVGKTALVGERETLTINDLRELTEKLPSDARLFLRTGRDTIFKWTLQSLTNEYIDYRNASCSFTEPSFIELLECMKTLPVTGRSRSISVTVNTDEIGEMRGETAYLLEYLLESINSFIGLKIVFGDDAYTIKGYPSQTGNGSIIQISDNLAIRDKSEQKEGAWEFLKYVLSDEEQTAQSRLPVTNPALSALLEEYKSKYFYYNKQKPNTTNLSILDDVPENPFVEPHVELRFTEADAEEVRRFLNDVTFSPNYDQTAISIIVEEATDYFGGTTIAQKCAENIQNRVSIYLSEQN